MLWATVGWLLGPLIAFAWIVVITGPIELIERLRRWLNGAGA